MASVHWHRVRKEFDDGTVGVEDLDLDVSDGQFVVLVGPSGSGKSTALRLAAGLEQTTSGEISIGDRDVTELPPRERDIAMVFQTYALYPHMTVGENLGFALRMRGAPRAEITARTGETASRLGIANLLARRPAQLSGGQRQRVALGRAIVRDPQAFFMDEPLSNLDAQLRVEMRAYIAKLHEELGTTTIFVTHDQVEAMTMGDRVAVMRAGRLEQVDAPQALYDRPANAFVAAFIGSPSMNLLEGRLDGDLAGLGVEVAGARLRLPEAALAGAERYHRGVIVGIRPEALRRAGAEAEAIAGRVLLAESLGSDVLVHVEVDAPPVLTGAVAELGEEIGTGNGKGEADPLLTAQRARVTVRLPVAEAPRAGDPLRLAVDAERIHFFDPEDGRALN
jgi:multiple sugar transport system ATP-binding protein